MDESVSVQDIPIMELTNVRELRQKLLIAHKELVNLRPAPRTEVDLESLISLIETCLKLTQ